MPSPRKFSRWEAFKVFYWPDTKKNLECVLTVVVFFSLYFYGGAVGQGMIAVFMCIDFPLIVYLHKRERKCKP